MKKTKKSSVVLSNAALDEVDGGEVILRGTLDPDTLENLLVAPYQREVAPLTALSDLVEAFENGNSVPDIDLGMRGGKYEDSNGVFELMSKVFIIDGLQRVSAARHLMNTSDTRPRLGATVHFYTNEESERERFRVLNVLRSKLSPNVLARNLAKDYKSMEVLLELSRNKSFAMADRVSWSQRQKRNELITAMTLLKIAGRLHSHIGHGKTNKLERLAEGTTKIVLNIGPNVFRDNVKGFFQLVDECYGIQQVVYKEGAAYLRSTFLVTLAAVLSNHTDFWQGDRLFVAASLRKKIAGFPTTDPTISNLSGSGGKAYDLLYHLLVKHINSGKRTKRLTPRTAIDMSVNDEEED